MGFCAIDQVISSIRAWRLQTAAVSEILSLWGPAQTIITVMCTGFAEEVGYSRTAAALQCLRW